MDERQRTFRDMIAAGIYNRNRAKHFGQLGSNQRGQVDFSQRTQPIMGMGLGYGGMPGTMMSSTSGGRVPWQKGKALEDYMMKKLRNRDNEEFYKNSPVFGRKPKGITSPKPLQDYGDWDEDEQDPMFPNTPRPYRNPMFDTMPQNKSINSSQPKTWEWDEYEQ